MTDATGLTRSRRTTRREDLLDDLDEDDPIPFVPTQPERLPDLTEDGIPGSRRLSDLVRRIAEDAMARGLLEVDPEIPIDYRRVICLTDGSRIDVQLTRLLPCPSCKRTHGRSGQVTCPNESRGEAAEVTRP